MLNLSGYSLGKYKIVAEIGRGGMGIVYRAYDADLRRHVALKVLLSHLVDDSQSVARFQREAVTIASLKHPHIVTVHDVGNSGGYYYIVMELLEGHTLRQEIHQAGPLPLPRAVRLLEPLASALDYAHRQGVVHRDVKTSNVILGPAEHVTLTDFGLVKLRQEVSTTQAGLTLGSLECMAPEQITGEPVDHRADVYALGVVAYEMLSARLPYSGQTPTQLIQDILVTPPLPITRLNPALPPAVEGILARALAKQPHERFAAAGELAAALQRLRPSTGLELLAQDGRRFPLHGLMVSLGRNPDNNIVLHDTQVSRYHAIIQSQASSWVITDQNSTNGTFLNEQRLAPHQACALKPGDVLRLGNWLTFHVQESEITMQRQTQTISL